jgi:hypothetical protein
MTAEEKLRWLEEANAFVRKFVPLERLARWQQLIEGGGESGGREFPPRSGESASS